MLSVRNQITNKESEKDMMKRDMDELLELLLPADLLMSKPKTLPAPEDINTWRDLEERRLYLNSGVDDAIIDYMGYYIEEFNRRDIDIPKSERKPIKIYINSNGGSLDSILHICDLIRLSKTPIITIGQANCYSAGGLLLMAGHIRYCYKYTTFLLHSGSFGVSGNLDSVKDTMDFVSEVEGDVKDFVLTNTKIEPELYDKNYRKQWFLRSEDMLKYGIVDEILEEIYL